MDWSKIKEVLKLIVAYFKDVFEYFGIIRKEGA